MNIFVPLAIGNIMDLTQDCIMAFRSLGHKVFLMSLPSLKYVPYERIREEIRLFKPDFVFMTQRFRGLPQLFTQLRVPFSYYIVDNPYFFVLDEFVTPLCVVFIIDRFYIPEVRRLGYDKVFYLPTGVNPDVFKEVELDAADLERYGCDISFLGTSKYSYYKRYYLEEIEKPNNPKRKDVLDMVLTLQSENHSLSISDLFSQAQAACGYNFTFRSGDERRRFEIGLEFAASALYRARLVKAVLDFGLHLHGDEGWSALIGEDVSLRPMLPSRDQVVRLYNASKINLNITIAELKTAINLRPYEVSACRGFLLSDRRSDLNELFEDGREIVIYKDEWDLREKVRYYLDHPDERREIATNAKRRVLNQHTYYHRMHQVVQVMEEVFG